MIYKPLILGASTKTIVVYYRSLTFGEQLEVPLLTEGVKQMHRPGLMEALNEQLQHEGLHVRCKL